MRDGSEFAAYTLARWPALVRTLVLLGLPPDRAEVVAREGLTRCLPAWDRVRREEDVDVWVYRTLLEERRRPSPAAPPEGTAVVDPTIGDLEERLALLHALEDALDRLPPEDREAVALRFVAELDTGQVADVLGVTYDVVEQRLESALAATEPAALRGGTDGGEAAAAEAFREAGEAIPVRPAPVVGVVALARARRRRRLGWTAGGLAAALVLVAAGTWAGTRPGEAQPPPVVVTQEANPAGLAWYANGVLHLPRVTVELPQLQDMVEVPGGVVYADRAGRVVQVDGTGRLTTLGRTVRGVPIAGSGERGWVTWLDAGTPELVVHDTTARRELARLPVDDGARPIAVDQDTVYYEVDGASFAWTAGAGAPAAAPRGGLLDVSGAVHASTASETSILVSQPLLDRDVVVRGVGAAVSPDGAHVLTGVPSGRADGVRVHDAATGDEVAIGLGRDDVVLAAAFGPDAAVSFVLARRDDAPDAGEFMRLSNSGVHTLRTCDLETGTCRPVVQFTNDRGTPLLPH